MNENLELEVTLSAGKKSLKVEAENAGFNLIESGSIVAVIKKKDGKWAFTKGSYSEEDAELVGNLIDKELKNT